MILSYEQLTEFVDNGGIKLWNQNTVQIIIARYASTAKKDFIRLIY